MLQHDTERYGDGKVEEHLPINLVYPIMLNSAKTI